jgi:hypothetical protein
MLVGRNTKLGPLLVPITPASYFGNHRNKLSLAGKLVQRRFPGKGEVLSTRRAPSLHFAHPSQWISHPVL